MTTKHPHITLGAVESARITAIGFAGGTLAVQFKHKDGSPGATYHYPNIDADLFYRFQSADSKGKFFESHIRPLKQYTRVAEPPARAHHAA